MKYLHLVQTNLSVQLGNTVHRTSQVVCMLLGARVKYVYLLSSSATATETLGETENAAGAHSVVLVITTCGLCDWLFLFNRSMIND